jgi:hypothetical protein
MDTYARGLEIAQELEALGTRATLDPALANPPCVLVIPPNLTFDLQCESVTAAWQLVALAPAPNTADRGTWQALDLMVTNLQKVTDIHDAVLVAYSLNGRTHPAYLLTFSEGI